MFNIINYQRNSNQNDNGLSSHTNENGHQQKNLLAIKAGKREPSYTVDGNVNWNSTVQM